MPLACSERSVVSVAESHIVTSQLPWWGLQDTASAEQEGLKSDLSERTASHLQKPLEM